MVTVTKFGDKPPDVWVLSQNNGPSLDVADNSGREGAFDGLEAFPNYGVVADVEYVAAAWLDQQTGAVDEADLARSR